MIAHVDIDAFFASVEQVRNPRLAGRPVIVGNGVIASCSYEARRFGCRAAMSLRKALRLCPEAVVLDGDHNVYRAFAERVWEVLARFSPDMETLLDDAYLDLSGTERLNGSPEDFGRRLRAEVRAATGLSATCGIAASRVVARMASASGKPDGLVVVPPGGEEAFLRDKPVEKLPGVGPATAEVLRRLNIRTIGELAAMPPGSIEAILGKAGASLEERARGRDSRVVRAHEAPKSISRETAFHVETCDRREIEAMLYYLTERAARTLRDLGVAAKTATVKLRGTDFTGDAASRSLPRPSDQDDELYALARGIFAGLYSRRVSLRGVGVVLSNIRPAGSDGSGQCDLFDGGKRRRRARLYRTLDEIRRRYGYSSLIAGRAFELADRLDRDDHGFILRTPSLTK